MRCSENSTSKESDETLPNLMKMHRRLWNFDFKRKKIVPKFATGLTWALQMCIIVNIEWLIDKQYSKHRFYLQPMILRTNFVQYAHHW